MYAIDDYIVDTTKLTSSLVIKVTEVANAINDGILSVYGTDIPLDKKEWKYYMNISGVKHVTNNAIMVYVKHTNTIQELTNTLLAEQPELKNELLSLKTLYQGLIQDYPDDTMYIMGMLYPVDIDVAISAVNGTVLAYNKTLVQSNEVGIVRELEERIKGFLSRWHIAEYITTDELYLTSMLGVLYSSIPTMLMNIRSGKVKTNEVHRFHMEHFFRSHLDIWENIQLLDDKTQLWVYNNLEYLMDNVGQNIVISKVIDNILTPNGIGVGEYVLGKDDLVYDASVLNDVTKPLYALPGPNLQRKPLNTLYNIDSSKPDITTVIKNEIIGDHRKDTTVGDFTANYAIPSVIDTIELKVYGKQETKIIELNSLEVATEHGVDIVKVLIDEYVHMAINNPSDYSVEYTDPNTGNAYVLNLKNSVYMLLTLMQKAYGLNTPISEYVYNSVLDNTVTATTVAPSLTYDVDNYFITSEIIKALPSNNTILNIDQTNSYLNEVVNYYVINNKLMSNVNTSRLHANIETINNFVLLRGSVDLTINNAPIIPNDELSKAGIDLVTTVGYDYVAAMNSLLITVTGINVDTYGDMSNFIDSYIGLINKLTSYDLQVIKNVNYNKEIGVKHSTPMLSTGLDGVVAVVDATEEYVVSPVKTTINQLSNNFRDALTTTAYFNEFYIERVQ